MQIVRNSKRGVAEKKTTNRCFYNAFTMFLQCKSASRLLKEFFTFDVRTAIELLGVSTLWSIRYAMSWCCARIQANHKEEVADTKKGRPVLASEVFGLRVLL